MKRIHYFLTETVFSGLLLTTLLFSNCVTIDERYDYVKWSHKSADSKNCPKLEEGKESEFVKCNHDLELKKITKKEEAFSNLIKFKDGKNQISKPELDSYLNSAKDSFKAEKYTRAMYYSYFILQKSPDQEKIRSAAEIAYSSNMELGKITEAGLIAKKYLGDVK